MGTVIITVSNVADLLGVFVITGTTSAEAFYAWTARICEMDKARARHLTVGNAIHALRTEMGYTVATVSERG